MKRLILAAALLFSAPAFAQEGVTSAFEGFSGRGDQPVNIEADKLEVQETDQTAVFSGNVLVVQGSSALRTDKLTIFYEKKKPGESAQPATGDVVTGRNIRRLEAEGNVVVTSGNQKASGNKGVFDMPSNTVVLLGNVVVTQGINILRGDRLVVDLTTQKSRVESSNGGGRVQGVFGQQPKPNATP
ncbi:MAG TPA: lipopolysaccharide transport periplasmic protein LptA [Sphingomicrobium sp.]|nr:lipopolysaccharide transport periplasmic protein LptA [Sphingomicrobium sp.]